MGGHLTAHDTSAACLALVHIFQDRLHPGHLQAVPADLPRTL